MTGFLGEFLRAMPSVSLVSKSLCLRFSPFFFSRELTFLHVYLTRTVFLDVRTLVVTMVARTACVDLSQRQYCLLLQLLFDCGQQVGVGRILCIVLNVFVKSVLTSLALHQVLPLAQSCLLSFFRWIPIYGHTKKPGMPLSTCASGNTQ